MLNFSSVKSTRKLFLFFMAFTICYLVSWQSSRFVHEFTLNNLQKSSGHTLKLVVENMRGELSQYRYQPRLLAANPLVRDVLEREGPWRRIQGLNKELEQVNDLTGALDTYLMTRNGLTISASNWKSEKSFIGKNFNYRPYFKEAISGQAGRYFALGTTSGIRGYYFSYPVKKENTIVGAVVVKVDVGKLEASWNSPDHEIIVTDQDGVIFLSSHAEWRFKSIEKLDDVALSRIEENKRYSGKEIGHLNLIEKSEFSNGRQKFIITDSPKKVLSVDRKEESYMVLTADMAEAEWKVHILAKTGYVTAQSFVAMLISFFIVASLLFIISNIYERRRREAETMALQAKINAELEMRVKDRTAKLTKANKRLRAEVDVRRKTENELLHTQEDLVQASKLAALGQMSAGLSHELNQPLGAIRSYADNAKSYLGIGEKEKAQSNLSGISELTERMARIIKHLRTYARNEKRDVRPTSVNKAINEALGILQDRVKHERVRVKTNFPKRDILGVAGQVRLQQVFVNLISNAIDAMDQQTIKEIDIAIKELDDLIIITVQDNGPGIDQMAVSNIFDPFFTTKEVGQGMGLGLSITYGIIKQMGGTISAQNLKNGGAEFRVSLRAVKELETESL